jgi:hypothetical protein
LSGCLALNAKGQGLPIAAMMEDALIEQAASDPMWIVYSARVKRKGNRALAPIESVEVLFASFARSDAELRDSIARGCEMAGGCVALSIMDAKSIAAMLAVGVPEWLRSCHLGENDNIAWHQREKA